MDSKEFNRVGNKVTDMAQKARASKEFNDGEFDDAMAVVLKEDGELLQKLAKV